MGQGRDQLEPPLGGAEKFQITLAALWIEKGSYYLLFVVHGMEC
jgi:hypothetical protein